MVKERIIGDMFRSVMLLDDREKGSVIAVEWVTGTETDNMKKVRIWYWAGPLQTAAYYTTLAHLRLRTDGDHCAAHQCDCPQGLRLGIIYVDHVFTHSLGGYCLMVLRVT